jgi:hypothetical protein
MSLRFETIPPSKEGGYSVVRNGGIARASLEKAPEIDRFLLEVLSLAAINYGHERSSEWIDEVL